MNPLSLIPYFAFLMIAPAFALGEDDHHLDLTDVHAINISGDDSTVLISTTKTAPAATLGAVRHGWFSGWSSSWFGEYCPIESTMHVKDGTLFIEAKNASYFGFSNCAAKISVSAAEGTAISMNLPAAKIEMNGNFAKVDLQASAADFSLGGHAQSVDLNVHAMRASLAYDRVDNDEIVRITSKSLDAFINFGGNAPLDYQVNAEASLVDARQPSVAGAKPQVRIDAKFVRASIR